MEADERSRTGTVFAACGALMVLAVVLGTFLLVSGGPDPRPTAISQARPDPTPALSSAPAPTPTAAPVAPKRRCWDGTEVEGDTTCTLSVEDAQFAAFGLERADCRPGRVSSHARWSYECTVRGVDVHLATYRAGDRRSRLGTYGALSALGGGRVLAGGPKTPAGRWLRTYDDAWAAKGLLMYASIDARDPRDYRVLMGLQQRFPDKLLMGEPVVTD